MLTNGDVLSVITLTYDSDEGLHIWDCALVVWDGQLWDAYFNFGGQNTVEVGEHQQIGALFRNIYHPKKDVATYLYSPTNLPARILPYAVARKLDEGGDA